jgi:hypothetical protein
MIKEFLVLLVLLVPATAWEETRICSNQLEIAALQSVLDSYHFKYKWQNDVFDCADMSVANWRFLKARGYDPVIAIRRDPPNGSHCYVILPLLGGFVGVDTQKQNLTSRIGKVITKLEMWKICQTPEEVFAMDIRGPPVITGEVIVPN